MVFSPLVLLNLGSCLLQLKHLPLEVIAGRVLLSLHDGLDLLHELFVGLEFAKSYLPLHHCALFVELLEHPVLLFKSGQPLPLLLGNRLVLRLLLLKVVESLIQGNELPDLVLIHGVQNL